MLAVEAARSSASGARGSAARCRCSSSRSCSGSCPGAHRRPPVADARRARRGRGCRASRSIAVAGPSHLLDASGRRDRFELRRISTCRATRSRALIARPLGSNAAAWATAIGARGRRGRRMVVLRDRLRANAVPAVAVGIGLSMLLSPAPRRLQPHAACRAGRGPGPARPMLVAAARGCVYTLVVAVEPLESLNESTVALVLLAGLMAIAWRGLQLRPSAPAMRLSGRAPRRGMSQCLTSARSCAAGSPPSSMAWPTSPRSSRPLRPARPRRRHLPRRRGGRGRSPLRWSRSPRCRVEHGAAAPRHLPPLTARAGPPMNRPLTIASLPRSSDPVSGAA